jgi:hypothetical protein
MGDRIVAGPSVKVVFELCDIIISAAPKLKKKYQNSKRARTFCRHLAWCLYQILDDEKVLSIPKKQEGKVNRLVRDIYETDINTNELYRLFHDRSGKLSEIGEKEKSGQIAPSAPTLIDWLCDLKPANISYDGYLDKVRKSDITDLFRFGPSEYEHLNTKLKEKYDG